MEREASTGERGDRRLPLPGYYACRTMRRGRAALAFGGRGFGGLGQLGLLAPRCLAAIGDPSRWGVLGLCVLAVLQQAGLVDAVGRGRGPARGVLVERKLATGPRVAPNDYGNIFTS